MQTKPGLDQDGVSSHEGNGFGADAGIVTIDGNRRKRITTFAGAGGVAGMLMPSSLRRRARSCYDRAMPLAAALVAVSLLAAPSPPPVPPAVLEALVWHESRGNPRVVNRFGCVGLTQICLRILPACRTPAGLAAPACLAERARLLDPTENRREALKQLAGWRTYCLKTTGRARVEDILFGFGGFGSSSKACGMQRRKGRWVPVPIPRAVREIMQKAKEIARR